MFRQTKLRTSLLLAISGGMFLGASVVQAQTSPERIEVTGSRLKSADAESAAPLQIVTGEEIAKSGVTNIQELLLKNPVLGTPALSRTNSNFLTSGAGVATIDLRNLGSDRTLVLVDGRRFVSGVPGSAAVDLNVIPTDFIDRVEILTGGASATYGSDAVAGVVNFILKKNFNGISVDAQTGISEKGDDQKRIFTVTGGVSSADGKSNIMAHFGYTKQGAVYAKDRGAKRDDIPDAFLLDEPTPADLQKFTAPFYSSFAPQGRIFRSDGSSFTFDHDGNIIPFSTNGPNGDGVGATGFNRQDFRTIAVPTERYLFAAKGDLALNENHSLFMQGTYAQINTRSRLEPFPLGAEAIFPSTGGQVPAEFLVNGQTLVNPYVTPAILAQLDDSDQNGLRDYYFTRRLADVGTRGNNADRDTFRLVTGVKGNILQSWDYEFFVGYGATKEAQTSTGQVNVLNFKNALQAIPDIDDIDGDGNTTEPICLDADARAQGCVPVNIFGYNSMTPAMLNYIQAPTLLNTFTSQKMAGGTISGEAFNLPAGPVNIAAGFEWRSEYSRSVFDPLAQAGLNAGNAIPPTEGGFRVKEVFAEAEIPILKNEPFAKRLAAIVAARGSRYSTVGDTFSSTAALEWAPNSAFRMRATHSNATRAPNIGELFSPPSQTFEGVNDPCEGVTAGDTSEKGQRCLAEPGVAANVAEHGKFTLTQADLQGISGFDRGNPNVQEEKSNSWTLGFVYTPNDIPALRNFAFTADYFKIKVNDAIVPTPRQFSVDQCYTGDQFFCQFITRRLTDQGASSAGAISFIDSTVTNSGGLQTEGVDVTLSYADQIGPGTLRGRLSYTHLIDGFQIPAAGSEADKFAGEIGAPKNKVMLNLGYNWGPFGLSTTTTYIDSSALDDSFLSTFGFKPGSVKVPSKTYFDMQMNYSWMKSTIYLGIDNVFDTKPPRFDTNGLIPGGSTGTGTAADVYDPIGRRFYLGVRFDL